jgi:hypothetical protein
MPAVEVSTVIPRPVGEVWEYLTKLKLKLRTFRFGRR